PAVDPDRDGLVPCRAPDRAVLRSGDPPMTLTKPEKTQTPDPTGTQKEAPMVDAEAKRIETEDLNIFYGSFLAVKDVNVRIEPNKVTALIGSSGCGKSTFLRSLNRMHELIDGARVEGAVRLDGDDIYAPTTDPVLVLRQVGMVFQQPNPFPTM